MAARLITTLATPLPMVGFPSVLRWLEQRLLVQRSDIEVIAYDLDELLTGADGPRVTRFPAPWPRRFGTCTVAPQRNLAVFAGVHALRAVDTTGTVRWEVRHGCWSGYCHEMHVSYDEYDDNRLHQYAERGSAVFSADGSLVWAHIRGPLAPEIVDLEDVVDEWLVIDASDGRVLDRVNAQTWAAGSHHVPHTDSWQMGLSVGEGQDGVPLLWGRWNGETLSIDSETMIGALSR